MSAGSIIVDLQMRTASIETDSKRAQDSIAKLEKELRALQKSMNDTSSTYDNLGRSSRRAQDGMAGAYKGAQQSQAGFRSMNQTIQNTSYQLTDFVVQISGGTSALRAFSQQAPQFLGAFGGVGAMLGIVAALGGAIADLVVKSYGVKDTADKFKELEDAASAVATAIAMTGKVDLSSLGKNYREATKEGKALIDANVSLGLLMLGMKNIDATETFRLGIAKSIDDVGLLAKVIARVRDAFADPFAQGPRTTEKDFASSVGITEAQAKAIDASQKAFAAGTQSGGEYINVLRGIGDQYKNKMNPELEKFITTQGKYATELQKDRDLEKTLTDARERNYKGLEKATDGQKSFIQALKERTEKVEKGEIAMLRMQAAEKKVLAQAEPLLEILTKQEWTREADKYSRSLELSTKSLEYQNSLLGRSATEVEVLNNANKIRVDLDKQLIDMKLKLGEVDAVVAAQMRADAEATIAIQTAMITSRQDKERSAEYGIQRGFQSYIDNAGNAAKGMETAFTNAFKGMEDGIVQFAMTGKGSFADFTNAVIADIMRIYVRMMITGLITKAIGMFAAPTLTSGGAGSLPTGATPLPGSTFAEGGYTGDGGKYQPAGVVHAGEFVMTKEATSRIGVGNLYRAMRGYADGGLVGSSPLAGGANGGNVVVNIKNEAGADGYQASATARKNDTGFDIDILVRKALTNDLRSNGPMTQTIGATFGLRRSA